MQERGLGARLEPFKWVCVLTVKPSLSPSSLCVLRSVASCAPFSSSLLLFFSVDLSFVNHKLKKISCPPKRRVQTFIQVVLPADFNC